MTKLRNIVLVLAFLLLGLSSANAGVSFSVGLGSSDYYQSVGDYDYLPYAYQTNPGYAAPRINFHDMMGQYGVWMSVSPFGQVWKPYASNDWRPYTQGHWISTQQYGQMWEGYEPWAWAGYHYGNWIYARNQGWVWIPGYDWHAGRVSWARSYDSIGWAPSPPPGYDYSRGYLSHVGPNNQFTYNDNDFGADFGNGYFYQGGPYNDPRYRNSYYNPSYNNINLNLWFFINNGSYGYDNYSNYALGRNYTRHVFDRRLVRITNSQIDRAILERLVGQRIRETPVEIRQLQTDKQTIRVVVPEGNDNIGRVRKNSKEVVRDIIAPGFAEKQKTFKGQNSKNKDAVSRIFQQENVQPKIENLSSDQIIKQAHASSLKRDQNIAKRGQAEQVKLEDIEKKGNLQEGKKENNKNRPDLKGGHTESKGLHKEVQKQNETVKQKQHAGQKPTKNGQKQNDAEKRTDNVKQKQHDIQQKSDTWKLEDMDFAPKETKGKTSVDPIDSQQDTNVKDEKTESDKSADQKSKQKKSTSKAKNKKQKDQHEDKPLEPGQNQE